MRVRRSIQPMTAPRTTAMVAAAVASIRLLRIARCVTL
jgi:hypothetical protein